MQIVLIRHGMTEGNRARRYLGRTDEPLCAAGAEKLRALAAENAYPPVRLVYASPMRRCVETAGIAFPDTPVVTVPALREQDFGAFENRTYEELCGRADYRVWIETEGASGPAGGEARDAFWSRCRSGFARVRADAERRGLERIAVVAHGGTLMALLAGAALPERGFYGWQAPNGCGWLAEAADGRFKVRAAVGFDDAALDAMREEENG